MLTLALFAYLIMGIILFAARDNSKPLSFVERLFIPTTVIVHFSFLALAFLLFFVLFLLGSVVAIFKR